MVMPTFKGLKSDPVDTSAPSQPQRLLTVNKCWWGEQRQWHPQWKVFVFITVITPVASFLDPHRTSLVDRCAGKTCMHHILVMKHWSTVCKHYQLSRWRGGEALIIMLDDTKKASCWHQTTWKPLVCKHWILTANLVSCFTLNVRWKLWQQLFNSKKKHYGRSNWDCTDGYLSLGWCFFHVGLYWHHWLYIKMDHIRAPQKWSQTFWLLWYGLKLLTLYQTNQTKNSKYT